MARNAALRANQKLPGTRCLHKASVRILKEWMFSEEHIEHPYPSETEKEELMRQTGLTRKQLTNWFTNSRKRLWQPSMKQKSKSGSGQKKKRPAPRPAPPKPSQQRVKKSKKVSRPRGRPRSAPAQEQEDEGFHVTGAATGTTNEQHDDSDEGLVTPSGSNQDLHGLGGGDWHIDPGSAHITTTSRLQVQQQEIKRISTWMRLQPQEWPTGQGKEQDEEQIRAQVYPQSVGGNLIASNNSGNTTLSTHAMSQSLASQQQQQLHHQQQQLYHQQQRPTPRVPHAPPANVGDLPLPHQHRHWQWNAELAQRVFSIYPNDPGLLECPPLDAVLPIG